MQRTLQLRTFLSERLIYDVRIATKKKWEIKTKFKSFIAETFGTRWIGWYSEYILL